MKLKSSMSEYKYTIKWCTVEFSSILPGMSVTKLLSSVPYSNLNLSALHYIPMLQRWKLIRRYGIYGDIIKSWPCAVKN